jgi:AcrR family transcriptional regulator
MCCVYSRYRTAYCVHANMPISRRDEQSEEPPMSLRERKKAATRAALIATARKLFTEKGYENTTLEEICDAVQIHVTTFFSYFESKEELAFARTLEMLDMFKKEVAQKPADLDAMTLFWNFMHEFSLRSRTEEGTIMQRMDAVPALRSRYDSIVRQYEIEMARAFAMDAGVDPETDLYSRLQAAALLSTVVSTARWISDIFGGRDVPGSDPEVFPKMILSKFPSRKDVEKEQLRFIESIKRKTGRETLKAKAARKAKR